MACQPFRSPVNVPVAASGVSVDPCLSTNSIQCARILRLSSPVGDLGLERPALTTYLSTLSLKKDDQLSIRAAAIPGGGSGGGLLEKPTIEKASPGRESEFDIKRKMKMSPPYRVLLHNDNFNRREYVVQVLMKVIPGMTVDIAVNCMQEAHVNGMAVVIICAQEDAEEHCLQLRTNGLVSSIEPASGGGKC